MSVTLAGIDLPPDILWTDEFDHDAIAQAQTRTLGGALVVEETALTAGRRITLGGASIWVTRATVKALRALSEQADTVHTLNLRGQTFSVIFERPAIEAQAVIELADATDTDRYEITLHLLTVTP